MNFEITFANQPMATKDIHDRPVYPAYVSLAGVVVFTTAVSDPGGPYATREMEEEVWRGFAHLLHDALAEYTA